MGRVRGRGWENVASPLAAVRARNLLALKLCVATLACLTLLLLTCNSGGCQWPPRLRRAPCITVRTSVIERDPSEYPERPGGLLRTSFVFMVQAKEEVHEKWRRRSQWPSTGVVCLLWKTMVEGFPTEAPTDNEPDLRIIYFPKSSWTSGRNRMLQEAKLMEIKQKWQFEFFIFFDEDAFLSYRNEYYPDRVVVNRMNDDAALKRFTMLLLRDRPMRAGLGFNPSEDLGGPFTRENFGCIRKCHMDPIVASFHRTAVDILLPFTEKFDNASWYASGIIADVFASAVVPSYCHVYEEVLIELANQQHTEYPKDMDAQLLVDYVNDCLSNASFMDYRHDTPAWELRKKLAGGMGYHSGLNIGDHNRQVGEYPCRQNKANVDFKEVLGTEISRLWKTYCLGINATANTTANATISE